MKYIIISILLGLTLLLTSSWWMEVGPFIVEIKTDEPVDTPFVVRLEHNKGVGVQGTASDYSVLKVIYANTPTKFPSSRGLSVNMPMNIYVDHPLFVPSNYSNLSLLESSARGKNLGLIESVYYSFNRPEKYEISVEMGRLDEYIDSYWQEVGKKKGYSKEMLEESKTNHIFNILNNLRSYKRHVSAAKKKINYENNVNIRKYFQEIINKHITNVEVRNKLFAMLNKEYGIKE